MRIQSAYLKGFNFAVASSIRDGPVRGLEWAFDSLASADIDVLIIHVCCAILALIHANTYCSKGTNDEDAPYKYAGVINNLVPRSKLITIEGGGHDLTLEQPEVINRELVNFFESN